MAFDEIETALGRLTSEQLGELNRTLLFQIDHMARRIEYTESRRATIGTFAAGLLAASVAVFAIAMSRDVSGLLLYPFLILGFGFLLSALLTLYAWFRQTNPPYGFIQPGGARPWKWFYRDALQRHEAFTYDWRPNWWPGRPADESVRAFNAQWMPFARRAVQLADLRFDTLQNLQQVYLLHVNERYKNYFLSQLRTLFVRSLLASFLASLIGLAVVIAIDAGRGATPSAPTTPTPLRETLAPSATDAPTTPTAIPSTPTPPSPSPTAAPPQPSGT